MPIKKCTQESTYQGPRIPLVTVKQTLDKTYPVLKCQRFSLFTVVAATGDPLSGHRLSNP